MIADVAVPDVIGYFGSYGGWFVLEALVAVIDDFIAVFYVI